MEIKDAVSRLSALAHPSRLAVFRQLMELGPEGAFPGDLSEAFDLPAATLSFHLKNLVQAGLIEAGHEGRHIRYQANFRAMQELVDFLTQNCCGGDPSRCAPDGRVPTSTVRVRSRAD